MSSANPSVVEADPEEHEESPETPQSPRAEKSKVSSLLDRLRPPSATDLSRKRSILTNKKKGSYKPLALHKAPKNRSPSLRVNPFPNELLAVRHGKLFCTACGHEVSIVKSTLRTHVES